MVRLAFSTLLLFMLGASGLHAAPAPTPQSRQLLRFKSQCETQGIGKSCYLYARLLWSQPDASDRAQARHFLLRSCELKYKSGCQAYHSNAYVLGPVKKKKLSSCFKNSDLKNVHLTKTPRGQSVSAIKSNSFWSRVGFQEGDVWLKLNGEPIRSTTQILNAFKSSPRQSVFQIERGSVTTTLLYTCR